MDIALDQHMIHCHVYGNGPRGLIALHGYGETGNSFAALAAALGPEYSVFCPDLPLHGHTCWEGDNFGEADLDAFIQAILAKLPDPAGPFVLAGFSMGARLALSYAERHSARLRQLALLAPDGFHQNFWYWFSTQTGMGNRIFHRAMENPKLLFGLMRTFHGVGLLNEGIYQFSMRFLGEEAERKALYERWTFFRDICPAARKLAPALQLSRCPVQVFLGKNDRIITGRRTNVYAQTPGIVFRIYRLDAGHRLLKPGTAGRIAAEIVNANTP